MNHDVDALSDKEVFRRLVPASIKKVFGALVLFGLTFLSAHFYPSWTYDLCTLALFLFVIDILIVAWGTLLAVALFIPGLKSDKHPQTKYDIGASLVRLVEGAIVFACGYTLYTHFLK